MAEKKTAGGAVRYENPLMPDERLRQMYTAMLQVRMLEERLQRRRTGAKKAPEVATIRGEEAARASTALSLGTGDLLSDCVETPGMDLLLGVPLTEVRAAARGPKKSGSQAAGVAAGMARRLPVASDAGERLHMALGAAAALKAQGDGRVSLVYVRADEAGKKTWKKTLSVAGRRELPVIFTLLPEAGDGDGKGAGEISRRARGWGVPGFPVDGADAIGLYRVMQESLLRARAGEGPALIECIRFEVEGAKRVEPEDPVERLESLMLAKGAATPAWIKETRTAFLRRLGR